MTIPDTQSLLERSFIVSDIKLVQVPHCLILQMPRFHPPKISTLIISTLFNFRSGNNYKMYNRLRPSLTIKLNDILDKGSRVCSICGNLAFFECKLCSLERCINVIFIWSFVLFNFNRFVFRFRRQLSVKNVSKSFTNIHLVEIMKLKNFTLKRPPTCQFICIFVSSEIKRFRQISFW